MAVTWFLFEVQIIVLNLCDHLGGEWIFKFRSSQWGGYRRVNEHCIEHCNLTMLVEEVSDCFWGCCRSNSYFGQQIDQKLWAVIISRSGGIIWWCHDDDRNLRFFRMQFSISQSRWRLSDHLWGWPGPNFVFKVELEFFQYCRSWISTWGHGLTN